MANFSKIIVKQSGESTNLLQIKGTIMMLSVRGNDGNLVNDDIQLP